MPTVQTPLATPVARTAAASAPGYLHVAAWAAIAFIVFLSIVLRFTNLERKFYWCDEMATSRDITCHSTSAVRSLINDRCVSAGEVSKLWQIESTDSVADCIRIVMENQSGQTPAYYCIGRKWAEKFGTSVTSMRALPAALSLLAIPCIFWCCLELFETPLIAGLVGAFIVIAPMHLLFAQEARSYSLWTVTIFLSAAALLRALRVNTRTAWLIYAFGAALMLQAHFFSLRVLPAYAVFVLLLEGGKFSTRVRNFCLASALACLTFVPVFVLFLQNLSLWHVHEFFMTNVPIVGLGKEWLHNLVRALVDFSPNADKLLLPLCVALELAGLAYVWRQCSRRASLFIICMCVVSTLPLLVRDLIGGGNNSSNPRYMLPFFISLQLSTAYFLVHKALASSGKVRYFWTGAYAALVTLAAISCFIILQADTWWNKGGEDEYISMTDISRSLNRSVHPIVLGSAAGRGFGVNAMTMSRLLRPDATLLFSKSDRLLPVPTGYSDVFVWCPTAAQTAVLHKDGYSLSPVGTSGLSFRLTRLEQKSQ